MTKEQRELLLEILGDTEAPWKVEITTDPVSRSLIVRYEDLDDEWFREIQETLRPTDTGESET